jgi:hypothetical protein
MSCDAVVDLLTRESGRIMTPILKRRTFPKSIWMSLIRRGTFPNEMGEQLTALIYERSAPTDAEPTWSDLTITDAAEGGLCLPPSTKIPVASTTRTFGLKRRVLEGPDICNIDIRPAVDLYNQLQSVAGILGDYARIEWEIHDRHEYFRLCQTKVSITDCAGGTSSTSMATTYPASCPTQPLSWSNIEVYKIYLLQDGAGAEALLRSDGAPVGILITGMETAGNLIRQKQCHPRGHPFQQRSQPAHQELRRQLRLRRRNRAARLLQSALHLLRRHIHRGACFQSHCCHQRPESNHRFRLPHRPGRRVVLVRSERFHAAHARPPTSPAPDFRFNPVDYTGRVQMYNIPDRVCNPDGNVIFHRIHMAAASYPVEPERGVAFAHLRCDPMGCTSTCQS